MTTPPLVTVPTSSCVASVIMTITRVIGNTVSPFTLEDQSFKWPGEAWSMDFNLPNITNKAIAGQWKAFGVALEGTYGRFLMGDPSARTPQGIATGTPLVDGGSQTGNTLLTKGWSNSVTGILKAGDYIQLGTGTGARLHMVMVDADSDGSGEASLTIQPALRSSPADNAAIVTTDAKGIFKLTNNSFSWSVSPGGIYRFSFQAAEVVNA